MLAEGEGLDGGGSAGDYSAGVVGNWSEGSGRKIGRIGSGEGGCR